MSCSATASFEKVSYAEESGPALALVEMAKRHDFLRCRDNSIRACQAFALAMRQRSALESVFAIFRGVALACLDSISDAAQINEALNDLYLLVQEGLQILKTPDLNPRMIENLDALSLLEIDHYDTGGYGRTPQVPSVIRRDGTLSGRSVPLDLYSHLRG
jgi:hypothetical protein